mgnify:CR=1 FL=1
MMNVFVAGASGNVGKVLVKSIAEHRDLRLAGGWCREAGEDLGVLAGIGPLGVAAAADLEKGLLETRPDLVIDFSSAPVLKNSMEIYLRLELDAVIGTTGLTEDELAPVGEQVKSKGLRWSVAPNYGLGMNLAAAFVKKVRKYYQYVTIIDKHTQEMANAPSGTAADLAREVGPSGGTKSKEVYPGVLGADIAGVPVFSERMPWPGPYSEHELKLARRDEVVTVTVQDFTSDIYMDGIFLMVSRIKSMPAGTFIRSLSEILDL